MRLTSTLIAAFVASVATARSKAVALSPARIAPTWCTVSSVAYRGGVSRSCLQDRSSRRCKHFRVAVGKQAASVSKCCSQKIIWDIDSPCAPHAIPVPHQNRLTQTLYLYFAAELSIN